jgi:hypothetical protein
MMRALGIDAASPPLSPELEAFLATDHAMRG